MRGQGGRSRRNWLRLCSGIGLGGLAGCLRLTDGSETDGTSGDAGGSDGTQQSGSTATGQLPEENLTDAFDINHASGSQSSTSSTTDDGRSIQTELINIEPTERYLFGAAVDRHFVIEETESDRSVTIEPDSDTGTYLVERVRPEMEPNGQPDDQITVFTPEQDETAQQLPVTYDGDTSMFTDAVFGTYRVRLVEGSETIASTDGQIVGMGYVYTAEQSNGELRITRHPDTSEAWVARLNVDRDLATTTVEHADGDEFFRIDLRQLDVPSGQYSWSLELFPSVEQMQERRGSRIIVLRSPRDGSIVID